MKKVLLTIAILFSCSLGFSQNFEKSLANSEKLINDPKKKDLPKTWISRGDIFYDIASAPIKGVSVGLDKVSFDIISLALGKELEKSTVTIKEEEYEVRAFEGRKIYLDKDSRVSFWEIDKDRYFVENPMDKAYEAYMKAAELDVQKKESKKIGGVLRNLSNLARNEGSSELQKDNLEKASAYFDLSLKCSSNELVGMVDSVIIYYIGVMSSNLKDYPKAEKFLKKAIEIDYTNKGDAYARLGNVYSATSRPSESMKILEKGMAKAPENQDLLIAMINVYMEQGKDPKEILPLLHAVQQTQPDNATLYVAEAQLYEKIGDLENAQKLFKKSTDIDPTYFYGFYARGILLFNTAVKFQDEAGHLDLSAPQAEYDALVKKSDDYFQEAIEPFTKAHELDPKEKSTIQALKDIYLKFKDKSPENAENAEKFKRLFEE